MGEKLKKSKNNKENAAERGSRFFRNLNVFVGGVALGGAAVVAPPLAAPLAAYGGLNLAQGGGFEAARRYSKKKRLKKEKDNKNK